MSGYGGCTKTCEFGPYCGDEISTAAHGELCDDGVNDGFYGTCNADCTQPRPAATASLTSSGARSATRRATPATDCKLIACGNGTVDAALGEELRRRRRQRRWLRLLRRPSASSGPRCGDGVLQDDENEDCDDGEDNDDNAYGACTTECKFGPYCGDNINSRQPSETCDVGKQRRHLRWLLRRLHARREVR